MAYQVIARKYRPRRFADVVGQSMVVKTLKNAIQSKRVGHAYLFSGSHGTGKTSLARLFAKALNCLNPKELEPCGQCVSCEAITKSASLDVLEIDGASHRGIEEMRRLQETLALSAPSGGYKIYLIDEVHMLTREAFNALLKSLEEPPPHVKFFFATTEPEKIPLTILSRCQHFPLKRLTVEQIGIKLASIAKDLGLEVEKGVFERIAVSSSGSLRDAESLLDELYIHWGNKITVEGASELLGILNPQVFENLDKAIINQDVMACLALVEQLFASSQSVDSFLNELIGHFRHALLAAASSRSTAQKQPLVYSEEQCLEMLEILAQGLEQMKNAFCQKTTLELLLLRLCRVPHQLSGKELLERLQILEKRLCEEEGSESVAISQHELPQATPTTKVVEKMAPEKQENEAQKKSRHDTLMHFAAKELSGTLKVVKDQ